MPSTTAMRKGFNLRPGERIGAEIAACDMGHETMKKYQTYEYPCKIQFKGKETDKVKASWMKNIGTKPRIIHSEYGSPYECYFQEPSLRKGQNGAVVMTVKAIANRRRDIPTLRDIAQTQKPPEPREEISALKKDEYKVVRSHWATSKCGTCRDRILPGQMIARKEMRKRADSDHGWSHIHCLALEMRIGKAKQASTTKKRASTTKKRGRPRKVEEATAIKSEASRKRSVSARTRKNEEIQETNGKVTRGRKRKAIEEPRATKRVRKRKMTEGGKEVSRKQTLKKKTVPANNVTTGGDRVQVDGANTTIDTNSDRKSQKKSA